MNIEDISQHFKMIDDQLFVSGVKVDDIIDTVSSPLFIYDLNTITDKYTYLRQNMPDEVDIFYAMKANPNLSIVRHLTNLGAGIEVASEGELYACEKLGVNPRNIVFAGPSKTDEDIRKAIGMGIYAINAESIGEIQRINKIATEQNKVMDIELRINPEFEVAGAAVNMGGGSKKFGIDSEAIDITINNVSELKHIRLQGIHIFAGTGIQDSEGFLSNLTNCFRLASEINDKHFKVLSIDFGGGIGIPYSDDDEGLNIEGINEKILELIENYPFIKENNTRLIAEPGRYLVGQSGVYISKIIDRKNSRGREYVLVDGGAQHLLRPALIGTAHPTFNISRRQKNLIPFDVGGSLCTSVDFLGKDIPLPVESQQGDFIGVFCSGAYGYTESMPLFLSHDVAPEVLVYKDKYLTVRPKIAIKDVIDLMPVPDDLE
ncbi:diaminopimelate decarboxylase [Spirochaeta cellobiosiphila]|uniref:diaminopimelate decarboxylase n=1 Tax=Spirochaeta cellobiosiphila TaxID=504483 RepID=UPI0003FCB3C1|nr:diaminopimelate decarboxylase [Spirochaeta cellobiosiphila]